MSVTLIEDIGTQFISERSKTRKRMGFYRCDRCDTVFKAMTANVNSGKTKSCGCLRLERLREKITTHGLTNHRLYDTWKSMKNRCYRKGNKHYRDYGGRGIDVCDEWIHDFQSFFDWSIGNGYEENLTIDRIDNDKGYSPENCRFVDAYTQSVNKRIPTTNTSGYIGVSFHKRSGKWMAYVTSGKKRIHIGYFSEATMAAKERDIYIKNNSLPNRLSGITE